MASHDQNVPDGDALAQRFNRSRQEVEKCDYCSGNITSGTDIALYASNTTFGTEGGSQASQRDWWLHRNYCEACDQQEVVFPHQGTHELLYEATVTDGGQLSDCTIRAQSPADDGVPWDASELFKAAYDRSLEDQVQELAEQGYSYGHQDIVDDLRLAVITVQDLFDDGGDLQLSSRDQDKLREQLLANLLKAASGGEDKFHQQVSSSRDQ